MKDEGIELRKLTTESDRLVCFLYDLARDHLPMGKIEGIVQANRFGITKRTRFSNAPLAEYCANVAARLRVEVPDVDISEDERVFKAMEGADAVP